MQVAATSRPPLGPNVLAKYGRELRVVDGIGSPTSRWTRCSPWPWSTSWVRRSLEASQAEKSTGKTDDDWWRDNEPLLLGVLDPERPPTASRGGPAATEAYRAAYDPGYAFEFGLQRILDGIEVLVEKRSGEGRRATQAASDLR